MLLLVSVQICSSELTRFCVIGRVCNACPQTVGRLVSNRSAAARDASSHHITSVAAPDGSSRRHDNSALPDHHHP